MNSIHRQLLRHGSVALLGLGLAGCSSESASTTGQNASNNAVTNVPAPNTSTPPANNAMQQGANQHGAARGPTPEQMAMMKQNVPGAGNNPSAPGAGHDMAGMMAKQHGGAGAAAPPGAPNSGGAANSGAMSPDQMAAMMKQKMPAGTGSNPGAPGAPGAGAGHDMAAMMKQKMAPGAGAGGNPGAPGAAHGAGGAASPGVSPDQMAAMMKQNMGAQGQPPAGAGQPPGGAGQPPGGPNMAGRGGRNGMGAGGLSGQGGGAGRDFKPGSIDDTLSKFCNAMAEGDTATASEYISKNAKGLLASLREGNLAEDKIEEITDILKPVNELRPGPNQVTDSRRNLINGKDQSITIVLKKEKDNVYKIIELHLPKKKQS